MKRLCVLCFVFVMFAACENVVEPLAENTVTNLYAANTNAEVRIERTAAGGFRLLVEGQPWLIRGVNYGPVTIGESPGQSTLRDAFIVDDNADGTNDFAYETWVDDNGNGLRDAGETNTGDFALMGALGVNTIRLYQIPSDNPMLGDLFSRDASADLQFNHAFNRPLLRELYQKYGIRVIMGNFMGAWTLGSGADWEAGTDYGDPVQRENIKKQVQAMVLENMNEPFVLMWLLGNENHFAWTKCNAAEKPVEYATLLEEIAQWIHSVDTNHPVAVCLGDSGVEMNELPAHAPSIDLIGFNSYREGGSFGNLWQSVRETMDRPVFLTEYGYFAYNNGTQAYDETIQSNWVLNGWKDILANSLTGRTDGNSVGGVVFDWVDRWHLNDNPSVQNLSGDGWHQEYFGIYRYANASNSLSRRPRAVVNGLKSFWTNP